jgi:hypothetical protein
MANEIVVYKLPTIEQMIKTLDNDIEKPLMAAAEAVAQKIRKDWEAGMGASGQSMNSEKAISPEWKRQKEYGGKAGIINYTYHGEFVKSFFPRKFDKSNGKWGAVTISFGGQSKGIKNISESAALDISLSKRTDKSRQNARKKIANSSEKPVSNLEKARGLAYWRPKSFQPGAENAKFTRKAFIFSLRELVKGLK